MKEHDIEIYFNDELVFSYRGVSIEEIESMIKCTKIIYTKLYFIKNKFNWNYKAVIK